jgi:1-acyl-sn-glycerol-3-phosphate acyltransferase
MEPWQYDPARDLEQPFLERLRHFPREPDILVYGARLCAALLIRGWLRAYHRFSIVGRDNLPASGSFVMVANHASHMDTLCLLAALPYASLHRAFPAAAQDYFFVSTGRLVMAAVVANALPFARKASPRQSLSLCRQLLDNPGNILILFPEGTRSPTGELREFKPGVGLLVAGTHYPVLPCHLDGAARAWPKGNWLPRPRRVRLTIGPPRQFTQLERSKDSAVRISQELHDAVLELAPGKPGSQAQLGNQAHPLPQRETVS